MKKLLFVLAIVAVYGFSLTNATAATVTSAKANVTIVATDDTPGITLDDPKKTDVKKEATEKKAEGCCAGKTEAAGCPKAKEAGCPHAKECAGEKEAVPAPANKKK